MSYRLHWEGSPEEAEVFFTMKQVRTEIRREAKKCGVTYGKALKHAYIVTEAEYQAEQAEQAEQNKGGGEA